MDSIYWAPAKRGRGVDFTKEFYQLSLSKKYEVIAPIAESLDSASHDRLVRAILQHSTSKSRKICPVLGERKLSPIARTADKEEELSRG